MFRFIFGCYPKHYYSIKIFFFWCFVIIKRITGFRKKRRDYCWQMPLDLWRETLVAAQ